MLEDKLIPSFQQIPYTELVKRIDAGSNGVLELSNMLHERKDLHEKTILFELKMSKANIFQHEIPTSTSERMLGFFKNLYIFVARSHIKTHKEFNDSVLKELDDLKNMRTSTVNRTKQLVNNGLRDIQMAEEALEKAKKAFNKAKHDYERSVDKLKNCERAVIEHQRVMEEKKKENAAKDPSKFSMGRMFQSAFEAHPEQDRDKQIKKVERRSDEMIHAANMIIERKRSLLSCMDALDRYLQEAAAVFQELEVDRMRRMKSMMRRFCEAERAMLKAKEEQLTLLEESISYQEPEEDMLLFITQEKLTEATHKYGGAVKLLDEFLYRRRQPEGWSFTTCDEYKIVDHAQLISALIESVEVPLPASTTPTAAAAGGASLSVDGGEGTQRLAEYDTMDTPVGNLTAEEILNEERQSSAAVAQAAESNSKAALPVSPVTVALECIFNGLSTLTDASSETPVSQETDEAAASHPRTMTFQQWEDILQGEEARDLFLQVLDDKRCVSACLDEHGYTALAIAMQAMLSYCEQFDDTKRAMRVLNMSNTFYHPALGHEGDAVVISVPNDVGGGGASGGGGGVGDVHEHGPDHHHHHIVDPSKQYLQADPRLKKHPIWRKQNFWENALKEGVFVEMEKLQPSNWDELSPEGLKESVINIHNLVFGQLGTLSLTMREQSCLEKREVASHVLVMSRKFQLCEDQEYDLLHSITGQSIKEYQPPPIIPNAPLAPHDGMDGDVLPVGMNNTGRHSVTAASLAAAAGLAAEGSRSDSNDASTTLTSRAQRHSINAGPSGHVRPASVVVDGTATVITATNGGNSRRSSRTTDAPVVVNATVVTSNSDTSPTPVQAQPRGSHSSSNPFSFMLGSLSGGGSGGGESSGKRSRTASHNSHDDYYATL